MEQKTNANDCEDRSDPDKKRETDQTASPRQVSSVLHKVRVIRALAQYQVRVEKAVVIVASIIVKVKFSAQRADGIRGI